MRGVPRPDLAVRATAGRNLHPALAGVRAVSDAGRADLAGGVPDGEFSGLGRGNLAPGNDITGADGPGCTTWAFIPRSRSCLPRRELTKRMASAPKQSTNFAQPRCGAPLT